MWAHCCYQEGNMGVCGVVVLLSFYCGILVNKIPRCGIAVFGKTKLFAVLRLIVGPLYNNRLLLSSLSELNLASIYLR